LPKLAAIFGKLLLTGTDSALRSFKSLVSSVIDDKFAAASALSSKVP